jgi:hypothetical protein
LVAPVLANSAELPPLRGKAAEAVAAANLPQGRQFLFDEILIARHSLAGLLAAVARVKKLTADLPPEDEVVARLFETRGNGFQAVRPDPAATSTLHSGLRSSSRTTSSLTRAWPRATKARC